MPPTKIKKKWQQVYCNEKACQTMAADTKIPLPIIRLLSQRGQTDTARINDFLNPSLAQLPSPETMKGIDEAINLLIKARDNDRPVIIYGDYDVDGITGTSVLYLFLKKAGFSVSYYIPDRLTEGYGLNNSAIDKIIAGLKVNNGSGAVLISVDCGISDIEPVRYAGEKGMTVIITDHHQPPASLPPADVIINPHQSDCPFSYKQLAGAGVAFYLVMGLRKELVRHKFWTPESAPNLKSYLDLVALGTVSDMVPLQDINRILVKAGLEVMGAEHRTGLKELFEISGCSGRNPSPEDIAYRVAPRINAAGRIGDASQAVELLTTDNRQRAKELAQGLDEANRERRTLGEQVFEEAVTLAEQEVAAGRKSLVLWSEDWHPGVIGIAANRLVEKYCRPTILFSINGEQAKGSGRSIPALNLHGNLLECHDILDRFGGHRGAAGMSISTDKLQAFREKFDSVVAGKITPEDMVPLLWIDYKADIEELFDQTFLSYYVQLAPFGMDNPEPVFMSRGIRLRETRIVGGNHLKFSLQENGAGVRQGIGFGFAFLMPDQARDKLDLAYNIRMNEFRGEKRWECNMVDCRVCK